MARADEPATGNADVCVTAQGGVPEGTTVVLTRDDETRSATQAGEGCKTFAGLAVGRWTVRVVLPAGSGLRLLEESRDRHEAGERAIDVVAEGSWPTLSLSLTRESIVSGTVTDDAGRPLPGVRVTLQSVASASSAAETVVTADGTWRDFVEPGRYRIEFQAWRGDVMSRWHGGPEMLPFHGIDPAGEIVEVPPVSEVTGLATRLNRTGRVQGRVTGLGGEPLEGVQVIAMSGLTGERIAGLAKTGADGRYDMSPVAPGKLRVGFSSRGALPSFYGGTAQIAGSQELEVAPGAALDGIDAVLGPGAALSGRVVDTRGRPVEAMVTIRDPGMPLTAPAPLGMLPNPFTAPDGSWNTGHTVPDGTYVLTAHGRTDSDWERSTYGVDRQGDTPALVTVRRPEVRKDLVIVMRKIGEPLLQSRVPIRPAGSVLTVPISCPTGCTVALTARRAGRDARLATSKRLLIARGKAKAGAARIRLPLTRAGRRAVRRTAMDATAKVRPIAGPRRSFRLRLRRAR